MARFDRLTVLNTMLGSGLVPLFYHGEVAVAKEIVAACAEGGARVVEFANRGDWALSVFAELVAHFESAAPSLILGVGSVVDAPTAALAIAHRASFIVGPLLNPEVARLCNRRKVAYIPGCATTSEISQAEELGAEIVKVFPGGLLGGPPFVKAVLGPMPWSRMMVTGGVEPTQESVRAWIEAGAACVGIGSKLIRQDLIAAGDYETIQDSVRHVLGWIREARER